MHGHEKSDPAIVAMKPANKVEQPAAEQSAAVPTAAESAEPRVGTKGNAGQQSTCRTQSRVSVTQDVGSSTAANGRRYPRWEPYAGKPHVRFCAGGARQPASLPRLSFLLHCHSHPHLALSGGSQGVEFTSAFGGVAEVHGWMASAAFDANHPQETCAPLNCCYAK
jgi:hypothetical protein